MAVHFGRLALAAGRAALAVGRAGLQMAVAAAKATAKVVAQIAMQIAKWVVLGVQALIHAAKVALAWLISLGPIALVVAAVIAAVALIIANWDKVESPDGADLQYFKAYSWDGEALAHDFTVDFLAEKLGTPHQMRFGAYSLYGQ